MGHVVGDLTRLKEAQGIAEKYKRCCALLSTAERGSGLMPRCLEKHKS